MAYKVLSETDFSFIHVPIINVRTVSISQKVSPHIAVVLTCNHFSAEYTDFALELLASKHHIGYHLGIKSTVKYCLLDLNPNRETFFDPSVCARRQYVLPQTQHPMGSRNWTPQPHEPSYRNSNPPIIWGSLSIFVCGILHLYVGFATKRSGRNVPEDTEEKKNLILNAFTACDLFVSELLGGREVNEVDLIVKRYYKFIIEKPPVIRLHTFFTQVLGMELDYDRLRSTRLPACLIIPFVSSFHPESYHRGVGFKNIRGDECCVSAKPEKQKSPDLLEKELKALETLLCAIFLRIKALREEIAVL